MKMLIYRRFKKTIIIFIFSVLLLSIAPVFASEDFIYDLCYDYYSLSRGKILFIRYKNPLLDPVLKTFELYIFDPSKSSLKYVPRYGEKIYLKPVVSPDRTTICYHSLIEGRDFLVTKNVELGRNIRLSFDTGGYFLKLAIAYDDDTVAAVIKRGENKQAIYYISNSKGLLKRLLNGKSFAKIHFLKNGDIFYLDRQGKKQISGIVNYNRDNYIISRDTGWAKVAPDGNAIIYTEGKSLKFFRVSNRERITLIDDFKPVTKHIEESISFSKDGTALSIVTEDAIRIANIPSGDIFYYISMDLKDTNQFLTNYSFYIARGNTVFILMYKKPGQSLKKLFSENENVRLLGANPDDRYIIYQKKDKKTVIIYDKREGKSFERKFEFEIENVSFLTTRNSFYIIAISYIPGLKYPVKELYLYDFIKSLLYPISIHKNTKLEPYRRRL